MVDWKATSAAAGIKSGEFGLFDIAIGPLPKADNVLFKAIQIYSDGKESEWIQELEAGGEEPENPAPLLALAGGSGSDDGDALTASDENAATPAADSDADPPSKSTVTVARVVAVVGLLAGVTGLALAVLTRRAVPRSTDSSSS